jgi:hypothetical protein
MGGIIIELSFGRGTEKMSMKNFYWLPKWLRTMCTPYWNRTARYMPNMLSIVWRNRAFYNQNKNGKIKNAFTPPAQFLLNSVIKSKRVGFDYCLISLYLINPQNRPANEFEQDGLESFEV